MNDCSILKGRLRITCHTLVIVTSLSRLEQTSFLLVSHAQPLLLGRNVQIMKVNGENEEGLALWRRSGCVALQKKLEEKDCSQSFPHGLLSFVEFCILVLQPLFVAVRFSVI